MFFSSILDPLGPLWPTIGIFVEVIILFVIIGLYELCKKHHKTVKKKKYFSQKEEGKIYKSSFSIFIVLVKNQIELRNLCMSRRSEL